MARRATDQATNPRAKVDTAAAQRRRTSDEPSGQRAGQSKLRRELVENQLYQEASRLFSERGFAGTSLQDIADAVGMTRPSLYYYVKSKEDLFASVVTEITEGNAAEIRAITTKRALDPRTKLERIARLLAEGRARQPSQFLLVARSEAQLPPELAAKHKKAMTNVLRDVTRVIEDGIADGQFRPINARTAAFAVLGMCNWVAWWFNPAGSATPETIGAEIASLAVAMVAEPEHRMPTASRPQAAIALLREGLDYLEQSLSDAE